MISKPYVFTLDTVNIHFIWNWDWQSAEDADINEKFELYCYYYPTDESAPILINRDKPIEIQYYEPVSVTQIEQLCKEQIEDFKSLHTNSLFRFKIKRKEELLENAPLFPKATDDLGTYPVDFFYLWSEVTGCTIEQTEGGWFHVQVNDELKKHFAETNNPLSSYKVYCLEQTDNEEDYGFIEIHSTFLKYNNMSSFYFKGDKYSGLKPNTNYIYTIGYKRRDLDDDFSFVQNMITTFPQTLINKVIENYNYDYFYGDSKEVWTDVEKYIDITNIDYINLDKIGGIMDYLQITAGDYDENTKKWVYKKDIPCSAVASTIFTFDVSDCNHLKIEAIAKRPSPTAVGRQGVEISFYSQKWNSKIDFKTYGLFKTEKGPTHNFNNFTPLEKLTCQYDFENKQYECWYPKNILTNPLYIYQAFATNSTNGGTYILRQQTYVDGKYKFYLFDPDIDTKTAIKYSYDIIVSDIPVHNPDGSIKYRPTRAEIEEVTKDLNGLQYSISFYELANYKTVEHSEGEFCDSFNIAKLKIYRDNFLDVPRIEFLGERLINNAKIINNRYYLFIKDSINHNYQETFQLLPTDEENKIWKMAKNNEVIDNYALTDLVSTELSSKSSYTIIIKVFSANGKRNKTIFKQTINYEDNIDFLKALTYNYLPQGVNYNTQYDITNDTRLSLKCFDSLLLQNQNIIPEESEFWGYFSLAQLSSNDRDTTMLPYPECEIYIPNSQFFNTYIDIADFDRIGFRKSLGNTSNHSFICNLNISDYYDNYSAKPNTIFGWHIVKNNSIEQEAPYVCYNNDDDINHCCYFGYMKNAYNIIDNNRNRRTEPGLYNYDVELSNTISKISIFPQNASLTKNIQNENILLTFKITELMQQNCIKNKTSPYIVLSSYGNENINTWNNQDKIRRINFESLEYEQAKININFNKKVIVNSIQNLYAKCDELEITDEKGNTYYHASNLFDDENNPVPITLNNKFIQCKNLFVYITNGYIYSNDLKIYTLETAKGTEMITPDGDKKIKGIRNRIIKTDNITLYLNSGDYIDYKHYVGNGEEIQGLVEDNDKPVNFYIETFSDLTDDDYGDLIYKIEKIKEEIVIRDILSNDDNIVTLTQRDKLNKTFDKDFNINSYSNKIQLKNTKTEKIHFKKHQKNTLVNCVLEKKEL